LVFLWWQCVLCAYAWFKKVNSGDVEAHKFVLNFLDGRIDRYFGTNDLSFLIRVARDEETFDSSTIKKTVETLSKLFPVTTATGGGDE